MPDYKEMYKKIFIAASQAIEILQDAQKDAEKMYIEAKNDSPALIEFKQADNKGAGDNL